MKKRVAMSVSFVEMKYCYCARPKPSNAETINQIVQVTFPLAIIFNVEILSQTLGPMSKQSEVNDGTATDKEKIDH